MMNIHRTIIGLLVLQTYVSAAPSSIKTVEEPFAQVDEVAQEVKIQELSQDVKLEEPLENSNLEESTDVNPEEPKLDSKPLFIEESKSNENSTQSMRQKRFYNFYGYGVPPINPVVYPGYNKRDQSAETGVYGYVEDPLEQIQRRLHDITSFVRQPAPPPSPPSHFPFFFPVIYIPQFGCDCNSDNGNTRPPPPENPTPGPESNQTDPDPDKRFPDLNDDRQNWGIVTNETDTEYDEDEFSRPISFDPIEPSRPTMRPAPPVEHGSSHGSSASTPQTPTTFRPTFPPRRPSLAPPTSRPSNPGGQGQRRPPAPYPANSGNDIPRNEQPSTCDGAVLTCCHQAFVTYDCFVAQGCPDLRSYGDPCDSLVILQVIEKFQRFYGVKNGK